VGFLFWRDSDKIRTWLLHSKSKFGVAQRRKNVFTYFYKQAEEQSLIAISCRAPRYRTLSCLVHFINYLLKLIQWRDAGVVGVAQCRYLKTCFRDNKQAEERNKVERYWPLSKSLFELNIVE